MAGRSGISFDAHLPNVWTGDTRKRVMEAYVTEVMSEGESSLRQVRPAAVGGATSGKVRARIVLPPYPTGRNTVTGMCLNAVTPQEAERIAAVFQSSVETIGSSIVTTTTKTRAGVLKTRASMVGEAGIQISRLSTGRGRASAAILTRTG